VGKLGNALLFNGVNAFVTVADSPSLRLTTGMTLEAWVNPVAVDRNRRDVIYKGNDNYFLEAMSTRNPPAPLGRRYVRPAVGICGSGGQHVDARRRNVRQGGSAYVMECRWVVASEPPTVLPPRIRGRSAATASSGSTSGERSTKSASTTPH
jgi:hypothetical protein